MDLDRMDRDHSSLLFRVRPLPFLQQGFQNLPLSSWTTENEHPIIEPARFPRNSVLFFLSCSSCISMFLNATNRFNETLAYSR